MECIPGNLDKVPFKFFRDILVIGEEVHNLKVGVGCLTYERLKEGEV